MSLFVSKMLNVEQCSPVLISSPSATVTYHKRASSVPLIELRHSDDDDDSLDSENISVNESTDLNNETDSASLCSRGGICSVIDSVESMRGGRGVSPMAPPTVRIKHITRSVNGSTRFPKLDECAHFHYENVELGPVKMGLYDERQDAGKATVSGPEKENELRNHWFCVRVISNGRLWTVRRSYDNFRMLDRQLHRCVYDRKYSLLPELVPIEQLQCDTEDYLRNTLTSYLDRFSDLAGSLISCGPVLNWLELDNRGNRLIVPDEAAINTPAVAAAYVVRRYTAQATDEISFEVGDMISVIDMPPPEESTWWRGKKGFEVGFFPCECVEVIGDKVPHTIKVPKAPTKPVLRKHGKLIAFFRSFLLSRPSRRKLKQSGILKERVFGCDLGEHLLNTGREIPLVLKCCTEFIEEHGIVDGIYRLSGVNSNIQKLRLAFDEDRIPDLTDEAIVQDIHCVASLLKMYFRELPNPLLTYQLYDKFVNAVQSEEEVRLLRLRDVVQQLPPPHYRTLEYLMLHLAKVAGHGGRTGMTPKNVAIVWAPNLLRSKDVEGGGVGALHVVGVQAVLTEYLIRYADLIFNEKLLTFQSPGPDESSPRRARPKSLAISTPTKLLSLEEARSRALSANLPPTQQKYIDVGGGPDNLPPKYHTVIDFPGGKRGSGKIKKSPSGWKSFFSRGWHSGSTREKDRVCPQRKVSSGSLQHTSLPVQDVAITEADISHTKKLRTVKSAESLVLLGGGGSSCRNSSSSESFNISGLMKLREVSIETSDGKESLMDYVDSNHDSQNSPCLSLQSPHLKHNRSSSHESYFEQDMDIATEDQEVQDSSIYDLIKETMNKMKKESEREVEHQVVETHFEYQNQHETENEILQISDGREANTIQEPTDIQCDAHKSVRKQKLQNVETEVGDAKVQKLSTTKLIEKQSENVIDDNTDDQLTDDNNVTNSLKTNKTENMLTECEEPNIPLVNKMEYCVTDKLNDNIGFEKDQDDKEESKVVVERYGNEETVIVEVHATQESSDEEAEKFQTSSNLDSEKDLIDYDEMIKLKQTEEIDSGKSNSEECENKATLNIENKIVNEEKVEVPIIDNVLEDSNINEVNHSLNDKIVTESEANDDEDAGIIPDLKPGSLISEVMEEYLLILDKVHSKDDQQNSDKLQSLNSKSNAFIFKEPEHISKDETKLSPSKDGMEISHEAVATTKRLPLTQVNLDDRDEVNVLDTKREEVSAESEPNKENLESDFTILNEDLRSESKTSKVASTREPRQSSRFLDNVQLRHISNVAKCSNEHKRNSEPLRSSLRKHGNSDSVERKHMSEMVPKLEEKNTVKGLMLKFETSPNKNPSEICSSEKHSTKDIVSKPKTNHPSLFTQLKVLKLQSLQSGSSMTNATETVDPWSDPILDIEEQKESQSIPLNNRPSLIVQREKSPEIVEKDELSTKDLEEINKLKNLTEEKPVEIKPKISRESKERKGAMGLSVSTPDLADNNDTKIPEDRSTDASTAVNVGNDTSVSSSNTSQTEDESVRRERINRIKEERRAQLREKLRSESFRLEAEEKEKVLNEFRLRKHNNTTKNNSDNISGVKKQTVSKVEKEKSKESNIHSLKTKRELDDKSTTQHREVPKPRINTSISKGFANKSSTSEKQDRNKSGHTTDITHTTHDRITSKIQSPTTRSEKISYRSPNKERLKKATSLDSSKQNTKSDSKPTSPTSKITRNYGEKLEKTSPSSEKHYAQKSPSTDSRRALSSQCTSAMSQKRIRERAAMFEHPKDAQEMCRTNTSSSRFTRQRSSPSLNPSYVR
ncbi:uncharacterized protein [Centruroides vittatus]|uniref:uncharacterized protein isoform X2 n=1 Tax=Centruroides vittatus TaxID=120091 RepID=UPI00350F0128